MGHSTTGISASEEEQKVWREEAKKLDLSLSKYLRLRIRAGRMLWSAGDFQGYKLDRLVNEELEEILNDTKEQKTRQQQAVKSSRHPLNSDISEAVLRELPRETTGDSVTIDDLQQLVFGTKEEQRERIEITLKELHEEGKVTRVFDGGFAELNNE